MPMPAKLPPLKLKRGEDRRLKAGHLWVFSNEVDTGATPLRAFEPGQLVAIQSARDEFLGSGYVNPASLISARILSRDPALPPSQELLSARVQAAAELRAGLYPEPYYRLVFGESDGLPGLVVDRYGEVLVAQIGTAGMERFKGEIATALQTVLAPRGILWKNDAGVRELEGLDRYVEVGAGEIPEAVEIREGGARFRVPLAGGQKTGWFFDHQANRDRLSRYAPGQRVLDVFSYLGAWGIRAALCGAAEISCVDTSAAALVGVEANAALNEVTVNTRQGDAFDTLEALRREAAQFDVVILDPPAFVKRRKDLARGRAAYGRLNRLALELVADGGSLISCSCSQHLGEEDFLGLVQQAARKVGAFVRILERGEQGPDHPVHPAIRETRYLKALFCHVRRQGS